MKKLKVGLLASTLSLALMVGAVPAYANDGARTEATIPTPSTATRLVPQRDLGPCWAQAGRVVGGGIVAIASTVGTPWLSFAVIAGYLGAMANEPMEDGYFTC